ncbi:DUF4913 domain-containing protein [Streptomyces sp. NPDC004542]|uniref:DUF4913 domain-containing protein n=1 Tax=Streptomyces sp. NPDC004542 TaxID=3154281 RepID=UPI0033A8BA43
METTRTPAPDVPHQSEQNWAPDTEGWVRTASVQNARDSGAPGDPGGSEGPGDEAAVATDSPPLPPIDPAGEPVAAPAPEAEPSEDVPPFVLYKAGADFDAAVSGLALWVHGLLLPVYGREISSTAPWCPRWYEHMEAIAQLYGLWMAWQDCTGTSALLTGPAMWHRDYLTPVMNTLRDPSGIFAGCKPGQHRPKESPPIEEPGPGPAVT